MSARMTNDANNQVLCVPVMSARGSWTATQRIDGADAEAEERDVHFFSGVSETDRPSDVNGGPVSASQLRGVLAVQ
ncbi:hypothetical protein NQZ68_002177 [Dissostichus eleginoides]|nr:hypothetical protein NQZ68_002177 [Dissostichus eleginoides]